MLFNCFIQTSMINFKRFCQIHKWSERFMHIISTKLKKIEFWILVEILMVNSTGLCGENLNEDRHYRVVITAFSCIRQVELGTTDWVFDFKSWSMTRVWNHLSQEPVNSLSSVDITPACCKMSFLWNKKKSWSVRAL